VIGYVLKIGGLITPHKPMLGCGRIKTEKKVLFEELQKPTVSITHHTIEKNSKSI